ncbi:uncharacterized protein LOC143783344 [Ranitomeya variabilis]|uniref:uncharacterized protein LOC143783344 n=1 Tax=Ranitomeya variabilis TaxID=490064 RepID=UPI004057B886
MLKGKHLNECGSIHEDHGKYNAFYIYQILKDQCGRVGRVRVPSRAPILLGPRQEELLMLPVGAAQRLNGLEVLLEPAREGSSFAKVHVARSLAIVKNGRVLVRCINVLDEAVAIPAGTILAELFVPAEKVPENAGFELRPDQQSSWTFAVEVGRTEPPTEEWNGHVIMEQMGVDREKLTPVQLEQLERVLWEHQETFSQHGEDFGCTQMIEHEIPTGDTPPIRERYRQIPPALYQEVKSMVASMLDNQVIRESRSPWAAPVVLVRKKDGTLRFCVDYRKLNAHTVRDAYPLPRIEESLSALGRAKYFSTLDLASGYWQVPMAEKDRAKTAFVLPMGLFEFNRMPFGLATAPGTFQRLMEHCLGDLNFESVLIYLATLWCETWIQVDSSVTMMVDDVAGF